jgi:ubiquinone/menaquinone biosynthesis C-methylase UbiE
MRKSGSKQDKRREREFSERYIDAHSDYDLWDNETSNWILRQLGLTENSTNMKILDLACGTGVWSGRLAAVGHRVTSIDISEKMVRVAAQRSSCGDSRFCPLVGDIENLPIRNNTFDACFVCGGLHHFPSVTSVLDEVRRVLKQGGRLCVVEPNGSNPVMRLSYYLRLILDPFIQSSGRYASVNERAHTTGFYEEQCGSRWSRIRVRFFHFDWEDPSHAGWFLRAMKARKAVMWCIRKLLPVRYGCNFVMIIGE